MGSFFDSLISSSTSFNSASSSRLYSFQHFQVLFSSRVESWALEPKPKGREPPIKAKCPTEMPHLRSHLSFPSGKLLISLGYFIHTLPEFCPVPIVKIKSQTSLCSICIPMGLDKYSQIQLFTTHQGSNEILGVRQLNPS